MHSRYFTLVLVLMMSLRAYGNQCGAVTECTPCTAKPDHWHTLECKQGTCVCTTSQICSSDEDCRNQCPEFPYKTYKCLGSSCACFNPAYYP
ncbi:serine protease inhibitor Cvsi-2-like [Saccostrea cucullata]|uniref:serine protease inhibitor Cvsi-2-like n=1 Tax=Saccostrea cuccullata TaxID=36930 RepID=UPI002ED56E9B